MARARRAIMFVYIEPADKERLTAWSERTKVPQSEAMREALRMFFDRYEQHKFGEEFPKT